MTFGQRLSGVLARSGRLCVGVDPHPHLLNEWSLADSAAGAREFALRVIDDAAETVGMVKPQVAFFERFGAAGYQVLEETIRHARDSGLLVIADAKRSDVGSTMDAYAAAWLEEGSILEADAMTVSPFQGIDSLEPVFRRVSAYGKGVFVLCATSNPEAAGVQQSQTRQSATLSRTVYDSISEMNRGNGLGSHGLVIGATVKLKDFGLPTDSASAVTTPVLAPGFGFQGGELSEVRNIFGALTGGVIVSESRSLLRVGREHLMDAIAKRVHEVYEAFSTP